MKKLIITVSIIAGLSWAAQNLYVEAYSSGYEHGSNEAWDKALQQQQSISWRTSMQTASNIKYEAD